MSLPDLILPDLPFGIDPVPAPPLDPELIVECNGEEVHRIRRSRLLIAATAAVREALPALAPGGRLRVGSAQRPIITIYWPEERK